MKIDLVVRNASIHTMDPAHPSARTLAVHHGRVFALDEVDLTGLADLGSLYHRVAERASRLAGDEFVIGAGYDHTAIGGHPHRAALDRAAGGRPVVLKHRSGHVTTVNSPVLDRLGVLAGIGAIDALATYLGGQRTHGSDL